MSCVRNRHLILASILLCWLIYLPGLYGTFYFDDEPNILNNSALAITEINFSSLSQVYNSGSAGLLKRPIPMLSFGLQHLVHGFDPFYFKMGNLLIHCLVGIGIFNLVRILVVSPVLRTQKNLKHLPLLTMAIWLFHPINLTTVLYVVQRMAGLSALFCVLGMYGYSVGRLRMETQFIHGAVIILSSLLLFIPVAVLSKENGALLPSYCVLIEVFFYRSKTDKKHQKYFLYSVFALFFILPLSLLISYLILHPEWIINGYNNRDFTLMQRLYTESRVVWFYLAMIILPINSLLGLFHDDFVLSTSLFYPITTFLGVVGLCFLVFIAIYQYRKYPVVCFGFLFFLVGHSIESSIIALELVHEHRNYLPDVGVCFAIAYLLIRIAQRIKLKSLSYTVLCVPLLYYSSNTFSRATTWGNQNVHGIVELKNHPDSPRNNYHMARIYANLAHESEGLERDEYIERAEHYFIKSAVLHPNYNDGLFGLIVMNSIEGRKENKKYLDELMHRLEKKPFNANNYNYLLALLRCINEKVCVVSVERIQQIIEACKRNKYFRGKHKEGVMTVYRKLLFDLKTDVAS